MDKEKELNEYFTEEQLDNAARELADMEKHPEEYKSYKNVEELKEDLLSDDE